MSNGTEIFSLVGKTALITGATGYLGIAMSNILAEAGAKVLINSRSEIKARALVKELSSKGYKAEKAVFDVTSDEEVSGFSIEMIDKPLHIIINNAYTGESGNIEVSGVDPYISSYDVSLVASHRLLKIMLPNLRLAVDISKDASVINIASMYAMVSPDQRVYEDDNSVNPPFYGAAKAALLQWTRYAACEFGKEGIRINAISLGPFPSDYVQNNNKEFVDSLAYKVPMGRVGKQSEIKGPTLFLASSASSFVNGSNIIVDGGWTSW